MAATNVSDAVYSFKLLEALRGGDQKTLHPLLSKTQRADGPVKELVSPLHMAVRCAEYSTIDLVLSYKSIDVNVVEAARLETPLHIASSIGRADVVQLLLEQPDIDDTKLNVDRQDATAVAKSPEIAQLIQVSQAQLNMNYLQLLQAYERSPVPPQGGSNKSEAEGALYALLEKPRISAVDLNAISSSGTTLLHEAVRRKDTRMIETVLRKGGDVFCRDRKGKRALESTKDESIKALLRQFSNADPTLGSNGVAGQAPTFRGYMAKWTNFAGGYKTRWFVLENGVLSYYQTQEEEGKQSRGSINLRYAKIRADANDKHRFEIIADSTRSATKMFLRGAHPVERARWVQVLQQTQQFFDLERSTSRAESVATTVGGGAEHSQTNSISPSANSSVTNLHATMSRSGSMRPGGLLSTATASASNPIHALTAVASGQSSIRSGILTNNRTPSLASRDDTRTPTSEVDDFDIANGPPGQHRINMPHESEFTLIANSLKTQVDLSQQLLEGITASQPSVAPTSAASSVDAAASSRRSKDSSRLSILGGPEGARSSLQDALKATSGLVSRYQELVGEREAYLRRRYEQEIRAKRLWEENMTTLAKQHSEMEAALHEAAQENAARRKQLREVREQGGSTVTSPALDQAPTPTKIDGALSAIASASRTGKAADDHYVTPKATIASRRADDRSPIPPTMNFGSPRGTPGLPSETNEDADDEFFDAIESGNLPNLRVDASLEAKDEGDWPEDFDKEAASIEALAPYRQLRTKMPIGKDDRPSVSLWSILKSNIGKDLTKITFPVSFNEPTSMLQRMAEDMEFSECLDAAVAQADASLRVAFVAAFAMSNYSSTIGRVAKPFNPLLGETFEYARFDKRYRYVSEQVSHHPPISACYAESPLWEYMGCVDAKSKFLGRTFEIRPTGVAHVNLKIPGELAPAGDKKTALKVPPGQETRRIEHYSWNKVTTSVSGFIVGQPTIDHFGDMVVTNHLTGHKCVLTFKPRGWRGKDAFEIQGQVTDEQGQVQWEIAGRWNSQLVARRVGAGDGDLNPDKQMSAQGVQSHPQSESEYVLLWKNSEKGHEPFNLTPFAITLNALTKELRPALAPTDCRVRPDLAAFERGRFEEANTLKQALEDLQRSTRKKRETGELPAHKPRWFKRTVEADTNDVLWEPATVERRKGKDGKGEQSAAYWEERERVDREIKKGNTKAEWNDVFHIFGEYEVETPAS